MNLYGNSRGVAAGLLATGLLIAAAGSSRAGEGLDPARVAEVEAWLPAKPEGLGRPIGDRAWWDSLRKRPGFEKAVSRARRELAAPLPEQTDELFLEFSRTGNRTHWQKAANARRGRIPRLALAECLENQGRFIKPIEESIALIAAERTWVLPAHDRGLGNFEGKVVEIDLASSALGWELATVDWLLGEKLSAETRRTIAANLRHRILDPFRAMANGRQKRNWWMDTTNNWNAVCLAGVVGAALEQAADRRERAEFVAAADKYITSFLSGFTPDGYCSEGLGYWNYGFGHFVLLSETVRRATDGRLELLKRPEARRPAEFGGRIQIMGGVSPAFADCGVNARPSPSTVAMTARRLGLAAPDGVRIDVGETAGSIAGTMVAVLAEADPPAAAPTAAEPELRTWFDSAGVLVARPAAGSTCVLGVAMKGGNNAEHHNHNDLGSYVVVLNDRAVLLDPGAETYTARTFSARRYESKLLNSFGHPVPVVAGRLQEEGAKRLARVLESKFSDDADALKLDLTSGYDVPALESLEREFVYGRKGRGSLTVTDRVAFSSPQDFGTALITRGSWRRLDDGRIRISDEGAELDVALDAGGAEYAVVAEPIEEDAPVKPTRIGVNLVKPVREATIIMTVTPAGKGAVTE